jgi:hypothetical protein
MIEEVTVYNPDGFFYDCLNLLPCYCRYCLEGMEKTGLDPYDYASNTEYQQRNILEFAKEAKIIAGPKKRLYLNGIHYYAGKDFDTQIEIECLPGAWGYDYFWPHVSYARKIQKDVVYMTGRFQSNWGDFGGLREKASLENDYYDALCAGVDVCVGDHMHPAKNLEPAVYKTIGGLNEMVMQYEPYTSGAEFVAEIGILINAKRDFTEDGGPFGTGFIMNESTIGLTTMLLELKYTFDIINEEMDFGGYRLMIIPDNLRMNSIIAEKLNAYLATGGKILSSGLAGLSEDKSCFALAGYKDFAFDGLEKMNVSYYRFDDPEKDVSDMDYCTYSANGILFSGGKKIAAYIKAYFDKHWDGYHGYFYTPPERETSWSAASINSGGDVCHIAFSVFKAYHNSAPFAHKALVKKCISFLLPNPIIRTEGVPSTARVTLTKRDDCMLLHIKVDYAEPRGKMDIIEEHNILPAGAVVYIRDAFVSARSLPDRKPIAVTADGVYTKVILPDITGYRLIQLIR